MKERTLEKEYLAGIINHKISRELKLFKLELSKCEPEHVFAQAYHIDLIVTIYELLAGETEELPVRCLYELLLIPDILEYFYQEWLKTEDSFVKELRESMKDTLKNSWIINGKIKRRTADGKAG